MLLSLLLIILVLITISQIYCWIGNPYLGIFCTFITCLVMIGIVHTIC